MFLRMYGHLCAEARELQMLHIEACLLVVLQVSLAALRHTLLALEKVNPTAAPVPGCSYLRPTWLASTTMPKLEGE